MGGGFCEGDGEAVRGQRAAVRGWEAGARRFFNQLTLTDYFMSEPIDEVQAGKRIFAKEVSAFLTSCAQNQALVAEYDRLRGTNLAGKGLSPIEMMIDAACDNGQAEWTRFFDFCMEMMQRVQVQKS